MNKPMCWRDKVKEMNKPEEKLNPTPGSKWKHYNGLEYTVLFLTNEDSQYERHPPTVIYQGPNGKLWSRLLSDWHRSFTPVGSAFEEWYSIGPKLGDDETDKQLAEIAFEAGWEKAMEVRQNDSLLSREVEPG